MKWPDLDRRFLPTLAIPLIVGALLIVGVLFVHSASAGPEDPFPSPLAKAHLARVIVGLLIFTVAALADYRLAERCAVPLYLVGLSLLLFLLAVKWSRGGVVRWFSVAGISVQPSELAKLFSILLLARLLKTSRVRDDHLPLGAGLLILGIPFLLVAAQPDLGTALVFVPIGLSMLWVAGISRRALGTIGGFGVLSALFGYFFLLHDYQRTRVQVFLGLGDRTGAADGAYHVHNSMIAVGSGGPTGKGYGLGTHHGLGYLPEDHNDFIFGVIGEEWGLVGTTGVLLLFLTLFLLCLRVAWQTRDPFGRLLCVGVTAQLAFQTIVNIGMTVGLVPVTGLPLPFVSYGGTSMLIVMLGIGMVVGVGLRPIDSLHPDGLRGGTSERTTLRRSRPREARIAR